MSVGGARSGSDYYNKLGGPSRQWGDICYYFGYIEGSRELIMVDRDEVPKKFLEGDKAADARVKIAQQVKLLAFKGGIRIADIAQYLDVVRRNFDYWCAGDKVPTDEHYQALLKLQEGLLSGKITEENIAGGAKAEPKQSHLEPIGPAKVTPVTPTPPKIKVKKGAKKANDPPSRSKAPSPSDTKEDTTKAHCLNF